MAKLHGNFSASSSDWQQRSVNVGWVKEACLMRSFPKGVDAALPDSDFLCCRMVGQQGLLYTYASQRAESSHNKNTLSNITKRTSGFLPTLALTELWILEKHSYVH